MRGMLGKIAIVRSDVVSAYPGQEGRLPIWVVYDDGVYRVAVWCLPEFLVPAEDPAALAAKAGHERFEAEKADREAAWTRERAALARAHGLEPDLAERFYQDRRAWEYEHGDDS